MVKDYEKLLEKVRQNLPEVVLVRERFEIPKVLGHIEGNKTVISNFSQIAGVLGRETDHLLKYVLKELATPGEIRKGAVIFGAKIPSSRINEKIAQYAKEYVLCQECGKPDTKIIKEDNLVYIKCNACGIKRPIKSRV